MKPPTRRLPLAIRSAVAAVVLIAPAALGELTDKNVHLPPAPPPLPAAGQTFIDPTFGSTILRLTGPADGNDNINVYSYWPTFNDNSTRLFIGSNGGGTLYNFNPITMQASNKRPLFARNAPDGSIPRWDDAFWSGSDPNIVYGHSNLKLWAYNVNTTNYTLVKDFSGQMPAGHLFHLTKSADDQVFTFTKQNVNYGHTGNFAWRRDINQVVYSVNDPANTNELQVDKSGRYVMVSHNAQGANLIQTTIRDLQTNTSTQLEDDAPDYAPGHGDLGHGFSVAADNWTNRLTGRTLANPHSPYTVINWPDWSQGDHTSMRADDQTWALTSMYYHNPSNHPSTGLFRNEILLVKTDGSQEVRRLAHHHSNYNGEYYNSPRANISSDGNFVAFTSNWGNLSRRDVFIMRVGAVPMPTWNLSSSGNWHIGSNWTSGGVPNGIGAEAELGAMITAPRTVFADAPLTLGKLHFNNANSYNLAGAGSLTLQVSTGSGLIDVAAGSHKINLPLTIASDTDLTVASGASLKIADPLTVNAGKTLAQSGLVTYESTITLQAGASIDVQGAMIAEGSSYADVEAMVARGFNGGDWLGDGITSSTAAAAAGADKGLALGVAADADAVIIALTRNGDSDLTGVVDSTDFAQFLAGYDGDASADWLHGDYDYNAAVDADDFNLFLAGLRTQHTPEISPAFLAQLKGFVQSENLDVDLSSVPEPTAATMLLAAAATTLRRRARRS